MQSLCKKCTGAFCKRDVKVIFSPSPFCVRILVCKWPYLYTIFTPYLRTWCVNELQQTWESFTYVNDCKHMIWPHSEPMSKGRGPSFSLWLIGCMSITLEKLNMRSNAVGFDKISTILFIKFHILFIKFHHHFLHFVSCAQFVLAVWLPLTACYYCHDPNSEALSDSELW